MDFRKTNESVQTWLQEVLTGDVGSSGEEEVQ